MKNATTDMQNMSQNKDSYLSFSNVPVTAATKERSVEQITQSKILQKASPSRSYYTEIDEEGEVEMEEMEEE